MSDLEFLIVLHYGDVRWNNAALRQAQELAKKGMCEYRGGRSFRIGRVGLWKISDLGKRWVAQVEAVQCRAPTTKKTPTYKCPLCGFVWSTFIETCPCRRLHVVPGNRWEEIDGGV